MLALIIAGLLSSKVDAPMAKLCFDNKGGQGDRETGEESIMGPGTVRGKPVLFSLHCVIILQKIILGF